MGLVFLFVALIESSFEVKSTVITESETYGKKPLPALSSKDSERLRQQQIILAALVDRCNDFGWKSEDNIASCVKQEAYRDLQIQEQEHKLRLLEQKLASANIQTNKPLFLEILDFYTEESDRKENEQLRRDIMILQNQTRSLQSKQNTQAALNSLYRKGQ